MKVVISVSVGELIDKITILEIKIDKLDGLHKKCAQAEYISIAGLAPECPFRGLLKDINEKLWDAEEEVRSDLTLSRGDIPTLNDCRFLIKQAINGYHDSEIIEVKSY